MVIKSNSNENLARQPKKKQKMSRKRLGYKCSNIRLSIKKLIAGTNTKGNQSLNAENYDYLKKDMLKHPKYITVNEIFVAFFINKFYWFKTPTQI